jgi:hypothetical protein
MVFPLPDSCHCERTCAYAGDVCWLDDVTVMRRIMAILLGATLLQLITTAVEMRWRGTGDAVRLFLFAGAIAYSVSAHAGARVSARPSRHVADERFSGLRRRTVTLRLKSPRKSSRANAVAAE